MTQQITRRETGTLQAFYRRAPWVRIPVDFLDRLTTLRHWVGFGDNVTSRLFTVDSTRLARWICKLTDPIGNAMSGLRARSAGYRRVDWAVRKFFWAVMWSSTVAFRFRPRHVWKPRVEKPIRMLPPAVRHPDFKSDQLRAPDSVPLSEASFSSDLWVESLHLFQDVYPISVPNQDLSSHDPDERLKLAYPRLFHWIRNAPRWHPDFVKAAASNNLLGLFAAGGPFAKLLQCVDAQAGTYSIDLRFMDKYAVRPGLKRLGCKINYQARDGQLVVTDVEHDGQSVKPGDPQWPFAEQIATGSLVVHTTVWRQGMEYHMAGLAAFPPISYGLPPDNPIRRLLAPHMLDTTSVSYYTHLTLRRSGFDVQGFPFVMEDLLEYYNDGARHFDLSRLDIRIDQKRRGIPESLHYPYYPQALRYYELFENYIRDYVELYYPTDAAVAADGDIHVWFEALDRNVSNGIRGYVPKLDKRGLIDLCTVMVYSAVIGHDENSLWDYAIFLPSVVHEDGSPMTLGELQCLSNFQFLICSATSDLMKDFSYLALDENGAALMRRLQKDLAAMQAEMEAGEDVYWRLFPSTLKSSVAC